MATAAKKQASNKEPVDAGESSTSLGFIIKRIERMCGAAGFQNITLSPTKTKTLLSVQTPGATVETLIPTKIQGIGDSPWNFDYGKVSQAVAGRKAETVSIVDGSLKINAQRYEAMIVGSEASSVPRVETFDDATCEFTVNGELRSLLKDGLNAVNLVKSMAALPDITVHLSFKKKSVNIVSFDRSQMVSFVAENTSGQVFEMTLPLPKAQSLFKDGIGDAVFRMKDGVVFMQDGAYKMSSSLPPAEEASGVPIYRVLERAKTLRSATLPRNVGILRADLVAFLDNARALSKTSALLKFQVLGSKTKVTISADGNSVSATIATHSDEKFDFMLDVAYVQAIIAKSKEDISISMDDSSFIFKTGDLVYAAVLSSEPESAGKGSSKKSKKGTDEEED
jgi:hypothetical protein